MIIAIILILTGLSFLYWLYRYINQTKGRRARLKKTIILVSSLIWIFAGLYMTWHSASTPPSDAKLIKEFYDHRSDFEKLRGMFQQDRGLMAVAPYGIETTNLNMASYAPPEKVGFPRARFEEYLSTLKRAGIIAASHNNGEYFFLVKRWGFAGSGWGIAVISRDTKPANLVVSLDDFHSSPLHEVYRHIERSWYLWIKG